MYPTTTGVLDNNTYLVLEKDQQTLPEYFGRHGYNVNLLGKVFHGPNRGLRRGEAKPEKPAGWFTPDERATQQAEDPEYWSKTHSPYRNLKLPNPKQYAWANVYGPLADGDRGTDAILADQAIQQLERSQGADKPFFLAVGFAKPHVPLTAPKEFFDLYAADAMPLPADFDTEPRSIENFPRDEFRQNADLFAGRPFTVVEAREAMRAYYACITYMDAQLGRLLDKLEQAGLSKNTIVVLWGDHGWHLSEKGMWAKGTLFEVSAHGPVILADPRQAHSGQVCPRVVEYLDLYPTLLDLCGLPHAPWLEGRSLRSLLENPRAPWDKPAYTVQVRDWYVGRSVRNERWRYTEWDEGRRGAALFDHERDPQEMRNLAQDLRHVAVVREMSSLLRKGPIARRP
jgi:arylsulfatase A-like enzyme